MANAVAGRAANRVKFTDLFARISQFLRESYIEVVKKASWPTWSELKKSTAVVVVAVLIVALYIAGWDYLLSQLTAPLFRAASPR